MSGKKSAKIFVISILVLLTLNLVSSVEYDVGFITKNNPNTEILNIFLKDMNLTVDIIKDKEVKTKDLSSYKFLFIDDELLKNTQNLPIYKYDSVIMNKYYGPQFGLTDIDGVSQLAANDPLQVKKNSQILQVYTRATENNGVSIPYYYLDDENKANMTGIARTYTGNNFDFGDVIAVSSKGQRLINGKYSEGKICFFGIAKTQYWTSNAKTLFEECVSYVAAECVDDSECNDNDPYTYDKCLNSGTVKAECTHDPIICLTKADCGTDGLLGDNFCSNSNVVKNQINFTCNNAGTPQSYCSNITQQKIIEQCADSCVNGECIDFTCNNDADCNDNNNSTQDICLNPGTTNSSCIHNPINCTTDSQCNDNNPRTQDKCNNPGTPESFCSNNPIGCLTESDCGVDGFTGNNFCSGKNVFQKYTNFTCNNAGTSTSFCSNTTTNKVKQICADSCSNGQCVEIDCNNDLDCNDNNPRTVDECVNAGTSTSFCRNTELNCLVDSDCGYTGFLGENFCSNNDIFKNYQTAKCLNGGTSNSHCNVEIAPKLVQDCNDNNAETQDLCVLEGQIPSCTHTNTNIECRNDNECNDNNAYTQDRCLNPGTTSSSCENTPISCLSQSDCGTDGFIGNNFCSNNDLFRKYTDYSCVNAGTTTSFCTNSTSNKLVQNCLSTCSNNQCDNVQCQNNADCNDNNPNTQDSCINPGTSQSYCRNDQIECSTKSDCGVDGYTGNNFCSNNDVKRNYVTYMCNNAGTSQSYCSSSNENRLVQDCLNGCANGVCLQNIECHNDNECNDNNPRTQDKCINPGTSNSYCQNNQISCLTESDCGVDGYTGNNFCSNSNVVRTYTDYSCVNAGTTNSYCRSDTENRVIQQCTYTCSNDHCVTPDIECYNDGQCNDNNPNTQDSCINDGTPQSYCRNDQIECSTKSDCGVDGYTGNNFCSNNDVKRNYVTYMCNNAGTSQSYCSSSTQTKLIQQCADTCSNGQCITQNIECYNDGQCNDNNQRTVDQCINAGTPHSYCRNTEVNCINNLDCGYTGFIGNSFCWNNDIFKNYQTATCVNPGTLQSYCNLQSDSQKTQDCNDNNAGTIDKCSGIPGRDAMCVYEPVGGCRNDADCGVDGYTGTNFCSQDDVVRTYVDYSCVNAETSNSYCRSDTDNRVVQQCTDTCANGQCVDIECHNDNECNDNNAGTIDKCHNAGTTSSYCTNTPVRCSYDSQCNDNNAYTQDKCINPGKINSYCRNDPIECLTKADCGVDGFTGNNFCSNNDVKRNYVTYMCNNAGTSQSYCSSSNENKLIDDCSASEMCSNGQCSSKPQCSDGIDNDGDGKIDMNDPGCSSPQDNNEGDEIIECSVNSDCGVDGFIGNNYCSANGDAVRDFKKFTCKNPGSIQSYCISNTEQKVIDDCSASEMCSNGQCSSKPQCSDGIDNDGDGKIDMNDPGCSSPQDNDESDENLPQCSDGIDNDGDGKIDMNDPDCQNPDDNNEGSEICVYDPSKTYDCEVYQGTNEVLYWGNNNEWMCNRIGGNFQEKHIICYDHEWYEADPTWDWNPWNGDFIPVENVVPPCTQVGSWYVSEPDGIWIKGQVPANCPLMSKCKDVDFNCNNVIDQDDTKKITDIFDSMVTSGYITQELIGEKKNECSVLGAYLGKIYLRAVDEGNSNPRMTFNDITGRQDRINACYAEQIGCTDTDGGNNINVRGQIRDKNGNILITDKCETSSMLLEYVCGNANGFTEDQTLGYSVKAVTCTNGCGTGKCN